MLDQIPHNSKLVVAISGGPDSVYLLHQLLAIQTDQNLTLHLAHVNHNLRGTASDLDEKFVHSLAQQFHLSLSSQKIPASRQLSSEEQLRRYRYRFLEKIRQRTHSDYIVTAHHLDDQIETIVFNFFRGTGLSGLSGMNAQQDHLLRPLLNTPKTEILKYLQKHHLSYRIDQTNQDTNFNRNLIRHQILPLAQQINPQPTSAIINLKNIIDQEQDYIKKTILQLFSDLYLSSPFSPKKWQTILAQPRLRHHFSFEHSSPILTLSLTKFKQLHPFLQNELVKTILTPFVPPNKQLTFKNICEIGHILNFSQGGSQKSLFNTFTISKKNDKIYLHLMK